MPNFWTKTTQMIYEAFKGPRTIDIEFNGKYEEIKIMVTQIKKISLTVKSFPEKLNGFKQLCSEICQHLIKPYPNDNIYFSQINAITSAHKDMINCYQECSNILGKLTGSTEEWHKTFNEVKSNLKKREEARKIHDHYEEKMEKLIEEKHKKMENNQEETNEEIQKYDRVSIIYAIYFKL
jgi:chromosome segregation ATPase